MSSKYIYLCITPERVEKTRILMQALRQGFKVQGIRTIIITGEPPPGPEPVVVWGQLYLAERILPHIGVRPFWHIDNGYWSSAKGRPVGYYRITYKSLSPILLKDASWDRRKPNMRPWREEGRHIVMGWPGKYFGRCMRIDTSEWTENVVEWIRQYSDRPILHRWKSSRTTIDKDLAGAHALVTHSSNVAVDAVVRGIPVFVAPTNPAAPVGNLDLSQLETPAMPERSNWLASLSCQQYTVDEMRSGLATRWMLKVAEQTDGGSLELELRQRATDG